MEEGGRGRRVGMKAAPGFTPRAIFCPPTGSGSRTGGRRRQKDVEEVKETEEV
jgi:hypothetical protein